MGGPLGFIGDLLGGLGMNPSQLPVVGNVGKGLGLWGDPSEDAFKQQLAQAAQTVQQYRPMENQAHLNTLGNQMSLAGPLNTALGQAYGPQFKFNTNRALGNPMPSGMAGVGAPPGTKPGPLSMMGIS